jgi:hypothetical protein
MRCKQCHESFPINKPYDMWEVRRQFVEPDASAEAKHVHLEDAGVFCSRQCVKEYLRAGDKSGVFDLGSRKAR